MKALLALVILSAALFLGACNSSSGSSAPTLAPLPTDTTTSAEPVMSPEASPS